jgi:hypothetical protein
VTVKSQNTKENNGSQQDVARCIVTVHFLPLDEQNASDGRDAPKCRRFMCQRLCNRWFI